MPRAMPRRGARSAPAPNPCYPGLPISKASSSWMQFDERIVLPLALPTAKPPAKSAGSAKTPFCHYKDGYGRILLAQQRCPGGWKGIFISFPMLLPGPAVWKTSPWAQQAWKQGQSPICLKSLHLNAHANVKQGRREAKISPLCLPAFLPATALELDLTQSALLVVRPFSWALKSASEAYFNGRG